MTKVELTKAESHFAFGENWASYSKKISDEEIDESVRGLSRLLGGARLEGASFLDIGSGSGLHSLAALRLGAARVAAVDIDANSVATTKAVLQRHASGQNWNAEESSVFDLTPSGIGKFDVVYSWGVLHHTGDMLKAVRSAAQLCNPNGIFIFALYRRVKLDWFWRVEKRLYAKASPAVQKIMRRIFIGLFQLMGSHKPRTFDEFVSTYKGNRGMDFEHDVHDWMGGWPYESITPEEVSLLMESLGFVQVRSFVTRAKNAQLHLGIFGSGCDEYVYKSMSTL